MTVKETLKPRENQRVMDLVAAAGVYVTPWSVSSKGPVDVPASNPAYRYEWAFTEPDRVVVLKVWRDAIQERNGNVWCDLKLRNWAEEGKHSETLRPSQRSALSKRALRMDEAIARAYREGLPVRVIVGDGVQRDINDPKSKAARMTLRLLDPEPGRKRESSREDQRACRMPLRTVRFSGSHASKRIIPWSVSQCKYATAATGAGLQSDNLSETRSAEMVRHGRFWCLYRMVSWVRSLRSGFRREREYPSGAYLFRSLLSGRMPVPVVHV